MSLHFNWDPGERSSFFLWVMIQAINGPKWRRKENVAGESSRGMTGSPALLLLLIAGGQVAGRWWRGLPPLPRGNYYGDACRFICCGQFNPKLCF